MSLLRKLLRRTRERFTHANISSAEHELSLEAIEESLLLADAGTQATNALIDAIERKLPRRRTHDPAVIRDAFRSVALDLLSRIQQPFALGRAQPSVILMVGVNGVGKTTSIAKLAHRFTSQGKSVMLAAGDTFRAAASEQLQTWGERLGVPVVRQQAGADSAAVIYDAIESARARGTDVLIADTAGRQHVKSNLMQELAKVKRIAARHDSGAPHHVLQVIDAGTGQNALRQIETFDKEIGVTGLVLTKLDGSAKGGMVFSIAAQHPLPLQFIGVGEQMDALQVFSASDFVDALLGGDE
ncbi:MAG: signal recognition particle-docking protein FtsY [Gammaproteobacteria bacterium]|nr:signal recognition particle-docking protein FtsY [Gammaproteobacteria bacterium]